MNTSEQISFEPILLGSERKLNKFEQYDFLYDQFIETVRLHNLLPVTVLCDLFNVDCFTESNNFPKNGESFKPINNFYMMTVDYSYFLVGLEIYSEDNVNYQPRFLTEIGYTVSDTVTLSVRKKHFVYNSIEELGNSILAYKKSSEFPCFVI